MEMIVHGYNEGCGFNATIPGTNGLWRSRYPMNGHDLRVWVAKQNPSRLVFTGDVQSAKCELVNFLHLQS